MPALHIRDIDDKLMKQLKSDAALAGLTLREHVIRKLGWAVPITRKMIRDIGKPVDLTKFENYEKPKDGEQDIRVHTIMTHVNEAIEQDLCGYEYCHHPKKRHGNKCCFVVDCRCGGFE